MSGLDFFFRERLHSKFYYSQVPYFPVFISLPLSLHVLIARQIRAKTKQEMPNTIRNTPNEKRARRLRLKPKLALCCAANEPWYCTEAGEATYTQASLGQGGLCLAQKPILCETHCMHTPTDDPMGFLRTCRVTGRMLRYRRTFFFLRLFFSQWFRTSSLHPEHGF